MAVPVPNGPNDSPVRQFSKEEIRLHAAKLYGQGFRRPQIARALGSHLHPTGNLQYNRRILAKWEKQKDFRDLIWANAVVEIDLQAPKILQGVTAAAKRGRVDAAKFALSVAGRYTDKSEMPAEVVLRLDGFTRPNDRMELDRKERRELNGPPD